MIDDKSPLSPDETMSPSKSLLDNPEAAVDTAHVVEIPAETIMNSLQESETSLPDTPTSLYTETNVSTHATCSPSTMIIFFLLPILVLSKLCSRQILSPTWIYMLSLMLVHGFYLCAEEMVSRRDGRHWLVQKRDDRVDMLKV
jgi:hypothetical protein